MLIALWIIAICELVRLIQNTLQLITIFHERNMKETAYEEFVKSLKMNDREFVKRMLMEFEKSEVEHGENAER